MFYYLIKVVFNIRTCEPKYTILYFKNIYLKNSLTNSKGEETQFNIYVLLTNCEPMGISIYTTGKIWGCLKQNIYETLNYREWTIIHIYVCGYVCVYNQLQQLKALYFAVNIFTKHWGQEECLFNTLCPIHDARDQ